MRVEPADSESVRWEHALLRFLANEIEQVVAPLAALDGSTFYVDDGHVVSVFPFLEGEELRSHEALFRQELPALLARLHRHAQAWPVTEQRPGVPSLRDRNWDKNDWWDWNLVEKPAPLVRAFKELRAWVADADDLRVCAIHGDFHTRNVLVCDGRVAGIVDWQYARRDWPALELAGMVWDLSWDGTSTTIDRALRDDLVQKYVASGGPGEAAAVVPLMRLESLVPRSSRSHAPRRVCPGIASSQSSSWQRWTNSPNGCVCILVVSRATSLSRRLVHLKRHSRKLAHPS